MNPTNPIEKQRPLLVWGTDPDLVERAFILLVCADIRCSQQVDGRHDKPDGNWQAGRSFTVHRSTRFGGCEMQAAAVRESFVRAVIANPLDDGVRLVFADWLEENGEPEYACFVRVQCELAAEDLAIWRDAGNSDLCWACWIIATGKEHLHKEAVEKYGCQCSGRVLALRRRERELLPKNWFAWTPEIGAPRACGNRDAFPHSDLTPGGLHVFMTFRRGFVEEVACKLEAWTGGIQGTGYGQFGAGSVAGVGAALVRAQPVTAVRVTDRKPFPGGGTYAFWWDAGRPSLSGSHHQSELPPGVFARLRGGINDGRSVLYDTEAAALADLSAACIRLVKGGDA